MNHFQEENQLLIQDIRNKFLWAIWFRYGLILLGAIFIYISLMSYSYLPLSLHLLAFVAAYNLLAHIIYAIRKKYKLWQAISLAGTFQFFDILAVTFLIYITGWIESPYWFLYLVMIIVSGFGTFSYYSFSVFLIAFFSAAFYFGLLLSAYLRILPIYGPELQLSPQELLLSIYNKAVFTSIAFFLFATTIYYFSKLLNQQREELSEKNAKIVAALEKIKAVDRLKDEFISTASHELRTPLSVIRENVSLIEDRTAGEINPQQKKLLETSRLNIDHLTKILDNLLDSSKIDSHSLELNKQTLDLNKLASQATELLKDKANRKNILIETKLPEKTMAWVDPEKILRVFINLLDNAIKYTDKNGRILIGVEERGQEIRGYVSDNGRGIPKKDFPRVFERFVHIQEEEEIAKGAGLGLSICKGIIEMHGGRIWFESPPQDSDQGTKFIFTLPKV